MKTVINWAKVWELGFSVQACFTIFRNKKYYFEKSSNNQKNKTLFGVKTSG